MENIQKLPLVNGADVYHQPNMFDSIARRIEGYLYDFFYVTDCAAEEQVEQFIAIPRQNNDKFGADIAYSEITQKYEYTHGGHIYRKACDICDELLAEYLN